MTMNKSRVLIAISLMISAVGFQNCGKAGTAGGDTQGIVEGTSTGNPTVAGEVVVLPFEGAVSVTMCVAKIMLRSDGGEAPIKLSDDFSVTLKADGSSLGAFDIPIGQYSSMQMELEDHCDIGASIQVEHEDGEIQSSGKKVTLNFRGPIVVGDKGLSLDIQAVLDRVNTVPAGEDIGDSINDSEGEVDDD